MNINSIEDVEQAAAEDLADMLQEIRDNIKKMGREVAMQEHAALLSLMLSTKTAGVVIMSTIVYFKLAELTAPQPNS